MSKYIYICCFCILISCCSVIPEDGSDIITIDIASGIENLSVINSSDLGNHVKYLPLQTSDSSLIGNHPNAKVFKNNIIVSSGNQPLKLFNKETGSYICNIGNIGEGPEEYMPDSFEGVYFAIDEKNDVIYVDDWDNGLHKYDLSGKYLGEIKITLPHKETNHLSNFYLLISNDTIWGHRKLQCGQNLIRWFCYDAINGKIISYEYEDRNAPHMEDILSSEIWTGDYVTYGGTLVRLFLPDEKVIYSVRESPSLWINDQQICMKENFTDTVFHISENKKIFPRIIYNMGKWKWDYKDRHNRDKSKKHIEIDYIFENSDIIYTHFQTGIYTKEKQSFCSLYNKKNNITKVMRNDNIYDDISNLMPIQIRQVTTQGEFMAILQPWEILNYANSHDIKNEIVENINEECNPVIILIHK